MWVRPDSGGSLTFSGLTENTTYIIKARIPATSAAPASLPTDGVRVTTTYLLPITVTASNYEYTYDGNAHGAGVESVDPANAKVTYSASYGSAYGAAIPMFTSEGDHIVYYRAVADGYRTAYGSYTVTIKPDTGNKVTKVNFSNNEDNDERFVSDVAAPKLSEYTDTLSGSEIKVELEVKPGSENDVSGEVQSQINDVVEETYTDLDDEYIKKEYLEMELYQTVDGTKTQMEELSNGATEIVISYDFSDKYAFSLIREHNGSVERFKPLSSRPASGYMDGTVRFDTAAGKIYVYTQKFSEYVIVYSTKPYTIAGDVVPTGASTVNKAEADAEDESAASSEPDGSSGTTGTTAVNFYSAPAEERETGELPKSPKTCDPAYF